MNEEYKKLNDDAFLGVTVGFASLPAQLSSQTSTLTPALAAAVTGGLGYIIAHGALGIDAATSPIDETSGALVAAFTYFVSSIVAPSLCSSKKQQQLIEKWNILKGAGGGATFGGIALLFFKATTDLALTGGVVTALAVSGAAATWFYNRLNKLKFCPHCETKGPCTQVVCRNCLRIFFPADQPIDCKKLISLTWFLVASQLHHDGLNYFEAMMLVHDNFHSWEIHYDSDGNGSTIDCESFSKWRVENRKTIAGYRESSRNAETLDFGSLKVIEGRS